MTKFKFSCGQINGSHLLAGILVAPSVFDQPARLITRTKLNVQRELECKYEFKSAVERK